MEYSIYGLCDPRSGELRYVGFTTQPIHKRLIAHISTTMTKRESNIHKRNWISGLLSEGLKPEVILLQSTSADTWEFDEDWNIQYFRFVGCRLLNDAVGGSAPFLDKNHSLETREKMRTSHLGIKHTPEEIEKIAKANTGKKRSVETKQRLVSAWKTRPPMTEATRKLYSQVKIGKYTGENSSQSKLTNIQRREIVNRVLNGEKAKMLAAEYGVSVRSVYNVLNSPYKEKWLDT